MDSSYELLRVVKDAALLIKHGVNVNFESEYYNKQTALHIIAKRVSEQKNFT